MTERKYTPPSEAGPGHRYVTRDGAEVTQTMVVENPANEYGSLVAVVEGRPFTYNIETGEFRPHEESPFDIFDAPKEPEVHEGKVRVKWLPLSKLPKFYVGEYAIPQGNFTCTLHEDGQPKEIHWVREGSE